MSHRHEDQFATTRLSSSTQTTRSFAGIAGRWVALGLFTAIIVGATFGPDLSYRQYQKIKTEISTLSQEDRLQLDRNLNSYKNMSVSEQQRFWEIHNYVAESGSGQLVDNYISWLGTLNPFQRQKLRNTPEAAAQIAVVEMILNEDQETSQHYIPQMISQIISRSGRDEQGLGWLLQSEHFFESEPYILSRQQLDIVVEEVLLKQLTTQDQMGEGPERKYEILAASINQSNDSERSWPSDKILRDIRKAGVKFESRPTRRAEMSPWLSSESVRDRLGFKVLLIRSLMLNELTQEINAKEFSNKELMTFFAQLDSNQQAALLNSPADFQADLMKWLYVFVEKRDELALFKKQNLNQIIDRISPKRPEGSRRGPDGRRPPDDGGPRGDGRDSSRPPGPRGGGNPPPGSPPPE